jgi:hypothetical protein
VHPVYAEDAPLIESKSPTKPDPELPSATVKYNFYTYFKIKVAP